MKKANKLKALQKAPPARLPKLKTLAVALSLMPLSMMAHAAEDIDESKFNGIGDLQIYQLPGDSTTDPTIMLMLDKSGSMGVSSLGEDYGCVGYNNYGRISAAYGYSTGYENQTVVAKNGQTVNFRYFYCQNNRTGVRQYDRLARLQKALIEVLQDPTVEKNRIGLAAYPYGQITQDRWTLKLNSTVRGKILVDAAKVTPEHQYKLLKAASQITADNVTPSAFAYAEAAAYLLGNTTLDYNSTRSNSSFTYGYSDAKIASGNQYVAPSTSQCAGTGIYFLTDGFPNYTPNNVTQPMMRKALGTSAFSCNYEMSDPRDRQNPDPGWSCIGTFSKALLRDHDIKTAVVGFGTAFSSADNPRYYTSETRTLTNGTTYQKRFYNCGALPAGSARNACNWGMESGKYTGVGGFGEGGFYFAKDTKDIVNSILSFSESIKTELTTSPSGTISIPDDPFQAGAQVANAYLPMLEPKLGETATIWPGNLKKYDLKNGTLWGKGQKKLFDKEGNLEAGTADLWSDKSYTANNLIKSGGIYAKLHNPNENNLDALRVVYVEDTDPANNNRSILKKISVNASGHITVNDSPYSANSFNDKTTYTDDNVRKLVQFLGFTNIDPAMPLTRLRLTKTANASDAVRVLGAVMHSSPASVSYSAKLDDEGAIIDSRNDDYVLFGSADGALHLANADSGEETFAFIPREILKKQPDALVPGSTASEKGKPKFGIDAPWVINGAYQFDFPGKKVEIDTQKGLLAYGGLRLGGKGLYGLDITNKNSPKMIFSLEPNKSGFARIGHIWAKPTKAKIKLRESDKEGTDVLVFGGGYDMCYEYPKFSVGVTDTNLNSGSQQCSGKKEADGNAVYIVNAKTGDLIWSASSTSGAKTTVSDMKHSVVGEITVLDRNNDGFMDNLYFADLGGQVFRADFQNAGKDPTDVSKKISNFSNKRVVRVLKNPYEGDTTNAQYTRRFYERPVVSFYRNDINNKLFALVNVISGDRSSPLSKIRNTADTSDRVYGIMDTDITINDREFYSNNFNAQIKDLTDSDFSNLPQSLGTSPSRSVKENVISTLKTGNKKGWYYPLIRFDGYNNVKYNKGVGKSEVIAGYLYTTVYNPDKSYDDPASCSAEIVGGSERQLYCLPYGVCMDDTSKTGTGGFSPAGKGIQELTLGPLDKDNKNIKLLIGTRSVDDRIKEVNDRVNFNQDPSKSPSKSSVAKKQGLNNSDQAGGDGSSAEFLYPQRFVLQPKRWYEK